MSTPYLWLGPAGEVKPDGTLGGTPIPVDKWTVRPLLGWVRAATDTFTPALLVHQDNPALQALLEVLGASHDKDPAVANAIHAPWRVYRFDALGIVAPPAVAPANFPAAGIAIVPRKDFAAVTLDAPPAAASIGPGGLLTLASPPRLAISGPVGGGPADFTLKFTLKELALKPLGFDKSFDLTGRTVAIAYDSANGKIAVNGVALDSGSGLDSPPAKCPLGELTLVVDGTSAGPVAGIDVPIGQGTYTHSPLVAGIAGSSVAIAWDAFVIRLRGDRLGLVAPDGAAGATLATASFQIPLIQAEVGPEAPNALAKLIPTADAAGTGVLAPLKFSVTLKRPTGAVSVAPLLWAFDAADQFARGVAQEALKALRGLFEDDATKPSTLSNLFAPLKELTAAAESAVTVAIKSIKDALEDSDGLVAAIKGLDAFNTTDYPMPVALTLTDRETGREFLFLAVIRLNLWAGRLNDNRAYFYLALAKGRTPPAPGAIEPGSLLDLKAFAVQIPARPPAELAALLGASAAAAGPGDRIRPSKASHDGLIDFTTADLVLDFQADDEADRKRIGVLIPGDLAANAAIERRVRLLLEDFDPAAWPEAGAEKLQLRLGARGLSLAAGAQTEAPASIPVPGGADLALKLVDSRGGLRSALVVIDNQVRYCDIIGRISVPGFAALEADVRLGLRRDRPEGPLAVTAVIDLDRSDRKPLARLNAPSLKAQLDDLRMQLTWARNGTADWDLRAWATGAASLGGEVGSTGGVTGLDRPRAIPFQDLDLTRLHRRSGKIRLGRPERGDDPESLPTPGPGGGTPSTAEETARFDLLDGQFRVEFTRAELHWDVEAGAAGFRVDRARFAYQAGSGELDVAVDAGAIEMKIQGGALRFEIPSYLGLQVRIGAQIAFAGEVGWVDDDREHFFRADGRVRMTGFPEVAGALKLGTGTKEDGSTAPNIAIFGELPFEADLFAGVVLKRVGLGLGVNDRLAALGSRPDSRTILANLDRVEPKHSRGWSFVTEKGVYVSVVASAMFASNRGKDDVISAYVAKLILSIDTNLDVVAVGRIWLFSSPSFVEKGDNAQRPALVAAADFKPRAQTFNLVAQTTQRPAIEGNKMLADLLSRARARFSFYLSPDLADYYLEELSYRDDLFGIAVQAFGSYRIAIGRFGALVRAQVALRGNLPPKSLAGGPGGFTFSGALQLDADFGGLVSSGGLAAYGIVRAGLTFRVSAFIILPTIAFQIITYDQTFSVTISIPYLSCKRWRCKWKSRDITNTFTVRISIAVPVVKLEPYHLPETSLQLMMEGALAFNETGGLGFAGTVGIATAICGHPLRIAPRFDFRPQVISEVRQRVAAVEDRIDRLRGLPRPPAPLPADTAATVPIEETWYYYTSRSGPDVLHLLVPSHERPSWWYTPRASGVGDYANLPRDTAASGVPGAASDLERAHLSPFRGAVTRMVLPFVDEKGDPARVVDLAMPWDRGNSDALPGPDAALDDDERAALVLRMTQIEAAFLNTAAVADDPTTEQPAWEAQEEDPNRVPLTGVDIVSDPRPETGSRAFWTLADQMARPDGVLPYRYRPVEELVAEGFSGVDRRDDIGRLLRYEFVRRRALRQGRHETDDPRPARRLAQARSALLSTILADFAKDGGPATYGPIDEIRLVRNDEGPEVVARRRAAIRVLPEGPAGSPTYTARLTFADLENGTELDLQPLPGRTDVTLTITWDLDAAAAVPPGTPEVEVKTMSIPDPGNIATRHATIAERKLGADQVPDVNLPFGNPKRPLKVRIHRDDENTEDAPDAPREAILVFEGESAAVAALGADAYVRRVGLFAVTRADQGLSLKLDQVRIIRNEPATRPAGPVAAVDWFQEAKVRVVSLAEPRGVVQVEAIQRWVSFLPPCQEFLEAGEGGAPRVRVRLPVRFQETLLKAELPRLNGFEIYRQLPGDPQPVKVADGVPPSLTVVDEGEGKTLLVESFLFGEDFPVDPDTRRFVGEARGVVPGLSQVRYFLRAIPYGRLSADDQASLPLSPWPKFTLHVPPPRAALPALGLVVPVDALIGPAGEREIPVHLVDRRPSSWEWPVGGWDALEVWADSERIRSSGMYAVTDDPSEVDPRGAQKKAIREPGDLTADRVPESVAGKVRVGTLRRPATPADPPVGTIKVGGNGPIRPGRSCRLYVRPALGVERPLVEPMALFLIRALPASVDDATPTLPVDRLELIAPSEVDRTLSPIGSVGVPTPRPDAWIPASRVTLGRRTRPDEPIERFRVTWEHPGDLDAGVEILAQDRDEPHRVGRMLVTLQEEAVFQMAHRDFRTSTLWRGHPEPIEADGAAPWPSSALLRSTSPRTTEDPTPLLLWRDERNPAVDRIRRARRALAGPGGPLAAFLVDPASPSSDDWVPLFNALAEYLSALRAYQRTPLAPADPTDLVGLDVLHAAARATLLGLEVDPLPPGEPLGAALAIALAAYRKREQDLASQLDAIARVDLSAITLNDAPGEYERVKAQLQDVDLARKLAAIVERRKAAVDDLIAPDPDEGAGPPGAVRERLPGFVRWSALVGQFRSLPPSSAPLAAGLLALFGDDRTAFQSTGKAGAGAIAALLGKDRPAAGDPEPGVRDPSILLDPTVPAGFAKDYRERVVTLVPQAAGLTAALDALGNDARAEGWSLLRRPHHQLGTTSDREKGRVPAPDPIRGFLPDTARGTNLADVGANPRAASADPALVVPFANLLERLGFAVDLAVIDALNQPLPQARLARWIGDQSWGAVRASIGADSEHMIVLLTGREPDTDRDLPSNARLDEDQALGFAFAKLAVVPRSVLVDLMGRQLAVAITAVAPGAAGAHKVTFNLAKADFVAAGLSGVIDVRTAGASAASFQFLLADLDATSSVTVNIPAPAAVPVPGPALAESRADDLKAARAWLASRSLTDLDDEAMLLVRRMAKAWWDASTNLTPGSVELGRVLVEPHGRRWATVPVLGSQAHIDWEAPDACGRQVVFALRRVSRYEGLLRWARGAAVPTLARPPRAEDPACRTLEWPRRARGRVEEPANLPVLASPHPSRIEFIYALPTSGARATVSGLSAIRNGYRGVVARFGHRRIDPPRIPLADLLANVARSEQLGSLKVSAISGLQWAVTSDLLTTDVLALVLLGSAGEARVSHGFTPAVPGPGGELIFTADEPPPAVSPPLPATVTAFAVRKGDLAVAREGLSGFLIPVGADLKHLRIASLDPAVDRVDDDPRVYVGQVLLILDAPGLKPICARVVEGFNPSDQSLTLARPLPANLVGAKPRFLLPTGAPAVRREAIPRAGSGPAALFRHDRLISLPSLPHYREYTVGVGPEFLASTTDEASPTILPQPEPVFARRPASLMAAHAASMGVSTVSTGGVDTTTYSFRIVVPRQGDLLTPEEARAARSIDADDLLTTPAGSPGLPPQQLPDADLPDLHCLFQILWRLDGGPATDGPVYAVLADVVLPGHPSWLPSGGAVDKANPVRILNRSSAPAVTLTTGVGGPGSRSVPLRAWQPSVAARPVYEVTFAVDVQVELPGGDLFKDPKRAVLQVHRDGHPFRPLPIPSDR